MRLWLETPDVVTGEQDFIALAGQASADWLHAWREGRLDDTLDNQMLYHRAALLSSAPIP